jgi:hypothetical protein
MPEIVVFSDENFVGVQDVAYTIYPLFFSYSLKPEDGCMEHGLHFPVSIWKSKYICMCFHLIFLPLCSADMPRPLDM